MKTCMRFFLVLLFVIVLSPRSVSAQSFTFGAAGDFANGTNFSGVVDAVARENPAFFLTLGDHSYSSGAEAAWCGKWKAKYQNVFLITGNHDSGESSGGNINTYVQHCPFTLPGLQGTYGHQYYFDYPSTSPLARFIMLRPDISGSGAIGYNAGNPGFTFTQSAIDDARAKNIPWVIVGFHKNYISAMEKPNEIGTDLMKLLIDKKVDLILQGHEHGYERSKQLSSGAGCATVPTNSYNPSCVVDSDNSLQKGAGSVIHVIGTGGQGLRGLSTSDAEYPYFAATDNTSNGFGKFTVSAAQLGYTFISSRGSFTDSFTISGTGTPPPVTPQPSAHTPTRTPPLPSGAPTVTPTPRLTPTTGSQPSVIVPTPTPITPCASFPTTTGSVTLTTTLDQGTYKVWSRMQGQNTSSNAFYLQIDDQCPVVVGDADAMPSNTWQWIDYKNGMQGDKVFFQLSSGTHVIKLSAKEIGTRIDSILLTADAQCVPFEMGSNCLGTTPGTSLLTPTPQNQNNPTVTPPAQPPTGSGKTLTPVADSFSSSRTTTERNGTNKTLHIDASPTEVAYLKFDLAGLESSRVQKAVLHMTVSNYSRQRQTVHSVANTSWTESTLRQSNKPSLGNVIGQMNGGTTGSTITVDITNAVKTRAGELMSLGIATKASDALYIYSRESSGRAPKLVITEGTQTNATDSNTSAGKQKNQRDSQNDDDEEEDEDDDD